MNKKFKLFLLAFLVAVQILLYQNTRLHWLNVDVLFLIIFYVSIQYGFVRTIAVAAVLGLLLDYFSSGILGVFSFSRTLAAYLLLELSRYLDLRRNLFIFLLIALSLLVSNLIASLFFTVAFATPLSLNLLVFQPLFTAALGTLIGFSTKIKKLLDVY